MPQQEMIFSDYLRVIIKHKWTVLVITAIVMGSTYKWASQKQPEFKSDSRIKIQRVQTFAGLFDEMLVSSSDPLESYVFEITGDQVLALAAKNLSAKGLATSSSDLSGAITVARKERTDLIDISIKGSTPEIAQNRCKAMVEAFQSIHDATIQKNAQAEHDEILKSLTNSVANLSRLDEEMRGKIDPRSSKGNIQPEETKLLTTRLTDATIKLQTLREEGNFTEDYPEIISQKNAIKVIQARLNEISDKEKQILTDIEDQDMKKQAVTRNYEQKRKVLEDMVSFLTKRYEESRIALTKKMENVEIIENPRPGTAITTAKAYLTAIGALLGLMLGIVFAFVAENLDTSIRTLVEIEEIFKLPILGVIPHFSVNAPDVPLRPEGFWDRIKYSELINSITIVWRALSSLVLGQKHHDKSAQSRSGMLIVPFSPRAPATEGFRSIRTNLQLIAGDKKIGAFLMTSAGPAEGKSTTITNLACAFAQGGKKTLLVGANMRRPSMYKTFGISRERGLAEVLVGELSWREVLKDHRDVAIGERADGSLATAPGLENLSFITCGGRTLQPAEWLSQPAFEATVREWEAEFDVVLIDGPPLLPVPDSVIMSAAIGNVVLVYQSGSTQRDSMLRAISLIKKTGARIYGLVLNDLRATWGTGPDYFHYRGYYGRPEKQ